MTTYAVSSTVIKKFRYLYIVFSFTSNGPLEKHNKKSGSCFCSMIPCTSIIRLFCRRFGDPYCLHIQDKLTTHLFLFRM
jgi:hypothetical protein